MPKRVTYTEADIKRLIADDLERQGLKVVPAEYETIFEFSTKTGVKAFVDGVVGAEDIELPVWGGEKPEEEKPTDMVYEEVKVLLGKNPLTVTEITALIKETFEDMDVKVTNIRPKVVMALSQLETAGWAHWDEESDTWTRKKRKASKKKPAKKSTAASILEGEGGVMDRGEGLEQGVTGGGGKKKKKPIRRVTRVKKRGRGNGGRGGGTPGIPFMF